MPDLADPEIVDPTIIDPGVVDPSETPPPEPGDDPVVHVDDPILVDPGSIPTLVDPIAIASVFLNEFACADDYDADDYELAANCDPVDAQCDITGGNGAVDSYSGQFISADVAAGEVTCTSIDARLVGDRAGRDALLWHDRWRPGPAAGPRLRRPSSRSSARGPAMSRAPCCSRPPIVT